MASQFFDQLAGPLTNLLPVESWYQRNIKYGIKCDATLFRDDSVKFENKRPNANFTNVLTTFGSFDVEMYEDLHITDGINAKVLNDYGQYDYTLVVEQIRLGGMKAENAIRMGNTLTATQTENVVTVLVNLLRFWVMKSSPVDKFAFKEDDIFYDDGHVAINYKEYLQKGFNDNFIVEFGRAPHMIPLTESVMASEGFFLPDLTGFTERDVHILRKYMSDIRCTHPSRLMFSTPQLADNIYMRDKDYTIPLSEVNETADEIYNVIIKFVHANRCQSQFDLAYTFVVMAMYSPLPRAVEANGWVSPINKMRLPKVGTARGLTAGIMSGIAYSTRPETEITWSNFLKNPKRIFVHAIAASEALFSGIFEIMTAGGQMRTDFFSSMGMTSAVMATPWRMMQECAAYRFGKAFETCWVTQCGPDLLAGLMTETPVQREIQVVPKDDLEGYDAYKVRINGEEVVRIRSKFMRPALFPVLSYGVNDDRYYLNKKEYTAEMTFRSDIMSLVASESDQVNKMMCIMRIAGIDCTVIDKFSGLRHRNWAANSNGQVMPIFNPNNRDGSYIMPVNMIKERTMNWMPMFSVTSKLKLGVKIDVKDYIVFANGKNVGAFNKLYMPVTRIPKPLVGADVTTFVVKTGGQNAPYYYQDFLMATIGIPVEREVVSLAPLAMEPLQPTEEQEVLAGQQEIMTEEQLEAEEV